VPLQTVYRWNRDGTGPMYFRLGKHARYSRNEVLRWLASKRAEELGYR
jgi:predicted DNA-binding transcriptional regulator AlpA